MEVIFLLFCLTFLLIKFFLTWTTSPARITNPPPSPPKLPVIGNLHQLGRHPHRSLRSLSIRYGSLMLLRLRRTPVLVVSSAEMARDVMKTHDRSFSCRPRWKMVEKLLSAGRDVIFAPYGEYWRQMKDVFVAGTDTTSTLLEWAMTQLLKHPNCMYKLRDEIRTISENKTYISEEVIENMTYLKAVIKETLRLHPPAPLLVPRQLIHDVKLKGYDILKGTQVIINAWAIGRETTTWGSDAEEFKPERHLDSHVDFYGHDFQLIPFGAGRRICPGIGFAMVTAELALANLVHRFDWKALVEPLELRNNMAESSGLIVRRSSPLIAYASIV